MKMKTIVSIFDLCLWLADREKSSTIPTTININKHYYIEWIYQQNMGKNVSNIIHPSSLYLVASLSKPLHSHKANAATCLLLLLSLLYCTLILVIGFLLLMLIFRCLLRCLLLLLFVAFFPVPILFVQTKSNVMRARYLNNNSVIVMWCIFDDERSIANNTHTHTKIVESASAE